jgi:hypothetical protein
MVRVLNIKTQGLWVQNRLMRWIFKGDKNPQQAFLQRGIKAGDIPPPHTSHNFMVRKKPLASMNKNSLQGQIHHSLRLFLLHATR